VTGMSVTDIVALILGPSGTRVTLTFDSCVRDYTIDLIRADTTYLSGLEERIIHHEISWEVSSPASRSSSSAADISPIRPSTASPGTRTGLWGNAATPPLARVGENAAVGEELAQVRAALVHAEWRVEALQMELAQERAARLEMERSFAVTQEAQVDCCP